MNKKIKVIELLNKIANDEIYRPTVKYQEMTYTYYNDIGDYTNDFNSEYGIFSGWALNLMLNNEVEILEDNTEEIGELPDYNYSIKENRQKINELVKAVNEIRKENKK